MLCIPAFRAKLLGFVIISCRYNHQSLMISCSCEQNFNIVVIYTSIPTLDEALGYDRPFSIFLLSISSYLSLNFALDIPSCMTAVTVLWIMCKFVYIVRAKFPWMTVIFLYLAVISAMYSTNALVFAAPLCWLQKVLSGKIKDQKNFG